MEELRLYEELVRLKKAGRGGVVVTVIASEGSTPRKAGAKMVVRDDGLTFGTVGGGAVEKKALEAAEDVLASGRSRTLEMELTEKHGLTCGGRVSLYLEPLTRVPQLLVVGKGHIAQALQEIGPRTGFAVTLLDAPDDPESGDALRDRIREQGNGRSASVVVACPSHDQDFLAARAALEAQAGFVGVVGSRRKRKNMDTYLAENGCSRAGIEAIVSPVGLSIGAQTPAEIALSILAQLVANHRNHAV